MFTSFLFFIFTQTQLQSENRLPLFAVSFARCLSWNIWWVSKQFQRHFGLKICTKSRYRIDYKVSLSFSLLLMFYFHRIFSYFFYFFWFESSYALFYYKSYFSYLYFSSKWSNPYRIWPYLVALFMLMKIAFEIQRMFF